VKVAKNIPHSFRDIPLDSADIPQYSAEFRPIPFTKFRSIPLIFRSIPLDSAKFRKRFRGQGSGFRGQGSFQRSAFSEQPWPTAGDRRTGGC